MSQQLVEDGQKIGKDISEKHVEIILTCERSMTMLITEKYK